MSTSVLDDPADIHPRAGKTGVLIIPSHDTGHAKYEWDVGSTTDTAEARAHFNAMRKKGYTAYRVDPKSGDKGEIIKEFDPSAGQIIMIPAFAGG